MNKPGDIILTRNSEKIGNLSPGYWNHVAISTGAYIIEAQQPKDAVITSEIGEFRGRYPEYIIFRCPRVNVGYAVAKEAISYIGTKYRRLASVFKFLRRQRKGENCVSLVRKCYKKAMNYDPGWKIPDDVYECLIKKWNVIEVKRKATSP